MVTTQLFTIITYLHVSLKTACIFSVEALSEDQEKCVWHTKPKKAKKRKYKEDVEITEKLSGSYKDLDVEVRTCCVLLNHCVYFTCYFKRLFNFCLLSICLIDLSLAYLKLIRSLPVFALEGTISLPSICLSVCPLKTESCDNSITKRA